MYKLKTLIYNSYFASYCVFIYIFVLTYVYAFDLLFKYLILLYCLTRGEFYITR